jgi:predicted dehydrogenase
MRFAVLGNHPDGLEMACALVESGKHELVNYSAQVSATYQTRFGSTARLVDDMEELLANPAIQLVIVAGSAANRAIQLRRALQSQRHVVCVHPPDPSPDLAYEASMLRDDAHVVLFPILPDAVHPAVRQLAELLNKPNSPLGQVSLLQFEVRSAESALLATNSPHKPCIPGWNVLRSVGGEIAELSALAPTESLAADDVVLVNGRFASGLLFQASYLPRQPGNCRSLALLGDKGSAELVFPHGQPGPAYLAFWDQSGTLCETAWQACDPWRPMVEILEAALEHPEETSRSIPSWQDVVRALELDDAARRSVEKRRASLMEYPEATEEAGFKGTMTLIGCGVLWLLLAVVIVANWYPALCWLTVPILGAFLGLQVFRWVLPSPQNRKSLDDPSRKAENGKS